MVIAMLCAAAVTAQFVSGKATRDALFLTSHDITALPVMLIVTAIFSMALVWLHAKVARQIAPTRLVPVLFIASGILFLVEAFFRAIAPAEIALLVYLHISVAGPLLASGFWLIVSESFSPRTAKKGFGRIAAAGTLGGLAGAIASERIATTLGIPDMLVVLGGLQFLAALLVAQLGGRRPSADTQVPDAEPPAITSGLRLIAETPYLRRIAALVLFGTASAVLVDYAFKAAALDAFGPGDGLLRFFAMYYGVTSLISFLLQILGSRTILERLGIGWATSTPSIAILAGILADLLLPGFGSLTAARGSEAVFRGSWFRSGYEVFFTPIPAAEKRAAKPLIDVAFDRLGDALGAAVVPVAILLAPGMQTTVILGAAIAASVGAMFAASQLSRWYVRTLQNSLLDRGARLAGDTLDDSSVVTVLRDLRARHDDSLEPVAVEDDDFDQTLRPDLVVNDIVALRSADHQAIQEVLSRDEGVSGALVPHVVALLANDSLAEYALVALAKVVEEHVGQLTDAVVDPNQRVAVRRRVARVLSAGVSQRAADGLLAALDDRRFEVRVQAARSLSSVMARNERLSIDASRIHDIVLREVAVGRPVWKGRQLLDGSVSASPLDEFVRDRAGQSLAHVFTLLSLILPREPLRIAFRSLQGDDTYLRGTALEYLEGVLPPTVRQALWPFLVRRRRATVSGRQDERVVALLRSSQSQTLQGVAARWDRQKDALKAVRKTEIAGFQSS
jgi:hypothetical protein